MRIWCVVRMLPAVIVYLSVGDKSRIDEDICRYEERATIANLAKVLKTEKAYRRIFLDRIKSESTIKYYLVRLFLKPMDSFGLGMDAKEIAGGFRVYHGHSTVVHCKSIGKNFSVYQNVTIGKGKLVDGESRPTIGDNVWVYTGAIVIGGITIGNNCKIGAGAVVTKDVPDNCTVVGNPMRIIQH